MTLLRILDVQQYQSDQRALARKSIAGRLVEARRQHEVELTIHQQVTTDMHAELEAKRADWQGRECAKVDEKQKRRQSIVMRLDSWRQQRLAEEKLNAKKALIAEEEARYREMDREDLAAAKAAMLDAERQLLYKSMTA